MSVTLSHDQVLELQKRYGDLINYESDDPEDPIDPISYVDSNGDALLHIAAQRGDLHTVTVLLSAGLDVNLRGDMGCTPLHYAYMKGHSELVEHLKIIGADSTIRNDFGRRPFEEGK